MFRDASAASKRESAATFYGNLESLRGIAALSVVVVHCLGAFQSTARATGSAATAIVAFGNAFNGRNAVVLFFVLSGFVLSESIWDQAISPHLFSAFIVRRAFRIVPVAYTALAVAALYLLFSARPSSEVIQEGAEWFVNGFQRPTLISLFLSFVFLSNQIVVVYWTLYVELMASLLFVPLLWASKLGGWTTQLGLQFVLLLASYRYTGQVTWLHVLWLPLLPGFLTYFFCFHLGILVNRLRHQVRAGPRRDARYHGVQTKVLEPVIAALGAYILCYAHSTVGTQLSTLLPFMHKPDALQIVLEAAASCLLVYGCSGPENRFLDATLGSRPMRYLGKLSFGIYAVHIVVLKPVFVLIVSRLGVYFEDAPLLGPLLALTIVIPTSIILAHLMHIFVEAPGIRFGRQLIRWAGLVDTDQRTARKVLEQPNAAPPS